MVQSCPPPADPKELQQNPYSVRLWVAYAKAKANAADRVRFLVYERAVKELPGSYKLWQMYLQDRVRSCKERCITDPAYESTNAAFQRALVFLHKMPRLWLDYLEFLMKQKKITRARRALDGALQSLPITQHARIWELFIKYIKDLSAAPSGSESGLQWGNAGGQLSIFLHWVPQ